MLGIPVVATSAKTGEGIKKLLDTVSYMVCARQCVNSSDMPSTEKNKTTIEKHNKMARDIAEKCISFEYENPNSRDRKIDEVITSKKFGIPIMLMFLAIILWITIVGANYPSKMLSAAFFELEKIIIKGFEHLNTPWWIKDIFIDGMYRTLTWVVSVMLPPMAIFFPLFTLLEDVGFLPRIAFNLDKSFHRACAHGKQALTTCMGFGCNAVGVTGCKIIDSPRERIIAILTNNFVPCNGRFSAIILISSAFIGAGAMPFVNSFISAAVVLATIVLGIIMTLLTSKVLSMTILKGMPSHFILELPPYRKPKIADVVVRSILDRTLFVLGRAVIAAAPAGIIIWFLANVNIGGMSILNHTAAFLNPFAEFFGFDGYILLSFILGIPANEIVVPLMIMSYSAQNVLSDAAGAEVIRTLFADNGWTLLTSINVILFMLMHFPCATTLMTIKKETKSIKWTALAFIIPTLSGLLICFLTTNIAKLLSLF
ncbi:MAG: ferrous iron transporter B [Clostridia bacterium]|nr:ferrous iron transporter B [Clostridia bacterium]